MIDRSTLVFGLTRTGTHGWHEHPPRSSTPGSDVIVGEAAGPALSSPAESIAPAGYSASMARSSRIWTVGHSNHSPDRLVELLRLGEIEYLADVRSYPYSRFAPHFNREELEMLVRSAGISYVFMGEELGGRPQKDEQYDSDGHALYNKMAAEPAFATGIERLVMGAKNHRLAIMCSCGKPDECHRRLLVGKVLTERGIELVHILPSGELRTEQEVPLVDQAMLFGEGEIAWRSTQSVSHRRRLSTSSPA